MECQGPDRQQALALGLAGILPAVRHRHVDRDHAGPRPTEAFQRLPHSGDPSHKAGHSRPGSAARSAPEFRLHTVGPHFRQLHALRAPAPARQLTAALTGRQLHTPSGLPTALGDQPARPPGQLVSCRPLRARQPGHRRWGLQRPRPACQRAWQGAAGGVQPCRP